MDNAIDTARLYSKSTSFPFSSVTTPFTISAQGLGVAIPANCSGQIYAYRFAVATGLRPGELIGLWYGDIKGNTVNLRRSINVHREQTTGKNENAIRSFDMGKEAREAYEAQVQLLKAQGILLNYNTPLFQIPSEHALYRRWESYQEANGLEPKVSLYELRHTFVSVESSVLTDSQLKMLVGHSKNMDTAGVYRHELDGQREDLAAATTAAFKKAQA